MLNTDVHRENTDVRWVGFHPPLSVFVKVRVETNQSNIRKHPYLHLFFASWYYAIWMLAGKIQMLDRLVSTHPQKDPRIRP